MEKAWIGGEYFKVIYKNGTHWVISDWEEEPYMQGNFEMCCAWIKDYLLMYEDSLY